MEPDEELEEMKYRLTAMDPAKSTLLAGSCLFFAAFGSGSGDVAGDRRDTGFRVVPGEPPNKGILFVDHEAEGRSGHGGGTLVEAGNGDILAFYSNVSGDAFHDGHGVGGWSEYRRSSDGGKTWSDPIVFDYSKEVWEGDEVFSALVCTVNKTGNGTLVAVVPRFADVGWNKQRPPVYFLSHDHGNTWEGPREIDPEATVEEVSMTYNGSFVCSDSGTLYIVFIGGVEAMCPGPHSLYATTDDGESFERRSFLPFQKTFNYGTGQVLEDGRLVVYTYPHLGGKGDDQTGVPADQNDEHNLPYVISQDGGRSWSEVRTAYFAKRLRNPQMSEKIGDRYFMHGRSGLYGDDPRNLVLYSSGDGLNWDEGIVLKRNSRKDGDAYSANAVVGKRRAKDGERLLIQSSVAYDGRFRVNIRHWWLEPIGGGG